MEKERINISISEKLASQFRIHVGRKFGAHKGSLSQGIEEAIDLWLKNTRQPGSKSEIKRGGNAHNG